MIQVKLESTSMSRVYFLWQRWIPMEFWATSIPKKYLKVSKFVILKFLVKKSLKWEMDSFVLLATNMSSALISSAIKELAVWQVKRLQSDLDWVYPSWMRDDEKEGLLACKLGSEKQHHRADPLLARSKFDRSLEEGNQQIQIEVPKFYVKLDP